MYLVLKFVHVLAVIMLVGNITVGIFWKTIADQTKDARIIAYTLAGIIGADRWFTIPGIILLLLGGFGAAGVAKIPILATGWILWALILFIIAGIAFGPLSRAQREMRAVAEAGMGGTMDWERYDALTKRWNMLGMLALITPLIAVFLMVTKPALPAFHS